jgi:hypothetical protein
VKRKLIVFSLTNMAYSATAAKMENNFIVFVIMNALKYFLLPFFVAFSAEKIVAVPNEKKKTAT